MLELNKQYIITCPINVYLNINKQPCWLLPVNEIIKLNSFIYANNTRWIKIRNKNSQFFVNEYELIIKSKPIKCKPIQKICKIEIDKFNHTSLDENCSVLHKSKTKPSRKIYITKRPIQCWRVDILSRNITPSSYFAPSGIKVKASLIRSLPEDNNFIDIYNNTLPNNSGIFRKREFFSSTELRYD